MQCDGDAKMANVEGSKDIMFILSPESKHIPIHYRNSTLIRVKTLKENCEDGNINEYDEYILPEQFEFGLNEEMKLEIKKYLETKMETQHTKTYRMQ